MRYVIVLSVAVTMAACGGSGGPASPAEAENCAELVETGMVFVQDMLDAVSELSLADIGDLGEDELPPAFDELQARSEELESRGDELGCTDDELEAEFARRVGDLEADGPFAQLILEGMRSEGFGFGE